jgi:hypothetical protein
VNNLGNEEVYTSDIMLTTLKIRELHSVSQETQPSGLPRGKGTIFGGLTNWEELPRN